MHRVQARFNTLLEASQRDGARRAAHTRDGARHAPCDAATHPMRIADDTTRVVQSLIELLPQPACLFWRGGTELYLNVAARDDAGATARCHRLAREHATRRSEHRSVEIPVGRRTLVVITLSSAPSTPATASPPARHGLPKRMAQVADLIAAGRADKEIAAAMGLTVASTRWYVRELYRRLEVHSRVELARLWLPTPG